MGEKSEELNNTIGALWMVKDLMPRYDWSISPTATRGSARSSFGGMRNFYFRKILTTPLPYFYIPPPSLTPPLLLFSTQLSLSFQH